LNESRLVVVNIARNCQAMSEDDSAFLELEEGRLVVQNPELVKLIQVDRLLKKRTSYQTSRQLAELSEAIHSCSILADKFSHLNGQSLRRVVELVTIEAFENAKIIFKQADEPFFTYLLLFGQAYLFTTPDSPTEQELDLVSKATAPKLKKFEAGSILGQEASTGLNYATSACAFNGEEGPTLVLKMNQEAFELVVR